MNEHPLRCRCGALRGSVALARPPSHVVCYCRDCQTYAHALGRPDVLDAKGGTEIVQTSPSLVTFAEGRDRLALLRLTPTGLFRWYARCCDTPIGNTGATWNQSFVGLVRACLDGDDARVAESFGPVLTALSTDHAKGRARVNPVGATIGFARNVRMMLRERLDGTYRRTPFFGDDGVPVVAPRVLTPEELAAARAKADAR